MLVDHQEEESQEEESQEEDRRVEESQAEGPLHNCAVMGLIDGSGVWLVQAST